MRHRQTDEPSYIGSSNAPPVTGVGPRQSMNGSSIPDICDGQMSWMVIPHTISPLVLYACSIVDGTKEHFEKGTRFIIVPQAQKYGARGVKRESRQ